MDKGEEFAGYESVCYVAGDGDAGGAEVRGCASLYGNLDLWNCATAAIYHIKSGIGTRIRNSTSVTLSGAKPNHWNYHRQPAMSYITQI